MSARRRLAAVGLFAAAIVLVASPGHAAADAAHEQVWETELAFARAMKDRDLRAFGEMLADETVFFSGTTALRGKASVIGAWAGYFDGAAPPFSWEPDQVEVLDSGTLALSTGPVRDPSGKVVARFNSIWRLEAPGRWRIVFDKGSPPTPGPK